ncbi:MAG: hypothetical protein AAF548_18630 [Actinomycetota bacterium]
MALTETQDAIGGDDSLHVDHFGLSIGPVSVGLPLSCTADDVYRRYLDLLRIIRRGPLDVVDAPIGDLQALSDATGTDCGYVARRLAALQLS